MVQPASSELPARARDPRLLIATLLMWALSIAPILVSRILPYADYPGHLARFHILANYSRDPWFSAFWRPDWAPLPNLGADLLIVGLAKIVPTVTAGRIGTALIVGLIGYGYAALYRSWSRLHGRAPHLLWSLIGFPLAWSFPLQMGFLNYAMGIGGLLFGFALHLQLRQELVSGRPLRYLLWMMPIGLLITIAHLMAGLQLVLLIGAIELAFRFGEREITPIRLVRIFAIGIALLILPVLYVLSGPSTSEARSLALSNPVHKVRSVYLMLSQGEIITDLLTPLLLFLGIGVAIRGGLRWSRAAAWLLLLCAAIFLISPDGLRMTHHIDTRQPIVLLLLALALADLSKLRSAKLASVTSGLIGSALAIHLLAFTIVGSRRSAMIDDLSRQLASCPPNSIIGFAFGDSVYAWKFAHWNPPLSSVAAIGTIDHRLYATSLFTIKGQQPLTLADAVTPLGLLPNHDEPNFPKVGIAEIQAARAGVSPEWRSRPFYLLFQAGDGGPKPGAGAELLYSTATYGLYRLDPVKPMRDSLSR